MNRIFLSWKQKSLCCLKVFSPACQICYQSIENQSTSPKRLLDSLSFSSTTYCLPFHVLFPRLRLIWLCGVGPQNINILPYKEKFTIWVWFSSKSYLVWFKVLSVIPFDKWKSSIQYKLNLIICYCFCFAYVHFFFLSFCISLFCWMIKSRSIHLNFTKQYNLIKSRTQEWER